MLKKGEEAVESQRAKNEALLSLQQLKCDNERLAALNAKLEVQIAELAKDSKDIAQKHEAGEKVKLDWQLQLQEMDFKVQALQSELSQSQSEQAALQDTIEVQKEQKKSLENEAWDGKKQVQVKSERIQMLENELINEQQRNQMLSNESAKLQKQMEERDQIQQNKDKLFSEF